MNAAAATDRVDAVRATLIDYVQAHPVRRGQRIWMAGLLVGGVLVGAGSATAAFAITGGPQSGTPAQPSGQPTPDLGEAVDAPPGTMPGAPIVSLLGEATTTVVTAATAMPLSPPAGATHLRVTVTALGAGSLHWGTDAGGNNPTGTWSATEVGTRRASAWYDFPLDATTTTLYLDPEGGLTAAIAMQYVRDVPTHLGVNARGQTYGVDGGPDGAPDLVAVVGAAPDGSRIEGYALGTDLAASSPDHAGMPTSPAQALEWQAEREAEYPDGWDVPVYAADGITQIGTFHIG